ncbi:hypothetical protein AKJ09_08682 [Labilithrix luteola]|uniref:Uncharacterized protein n=1 Tax=Labilithrix luteola TaxID=1391654 RepID=A0A0K1Q8G2_9BACT|nr:hypothetical protein AKJ09_08682 [Labilithrix luteola]
MLGDELGRDPERIAAGAGRRHRVGIEPGADGTAVRRRIARAAATQQKVRRRGRGARRLDPVPVAIGGGRRGRNVNGPSRRPAACPRRAPVRLGPR